MEDFKKLKLNNGHHLAYRQFTAKEEISKNNNAVIFLSGFRSDMESSKAAFAHNFCENNNIDFIRFDYSGTGNSSGDFLEMTISKWKDNALTIIEKLYPAKKVTLIGSSMGGWIMSLLACEIPQKIHSLIGIASAPDFTEKLMWNQLSVAAKTEIMESGVHHLPTNYCNDPKAQTYPITRALIEDGRKNNILESPQILLKCPITLIHGIKDEDVPYDFSLKLANIFTAKNVEVILQPDSKHRMSEPGDLALLQKVLKQHMI